MLLIEDDESLSTSLVRALEDADYRVSAVRFGTDAELFLRDNEPDVILLDLGLTDIEGLLLLANIRPRTTASVIVIGGRDTEPESLLSARLGADDFFAKPFELKQLLGSIQTVLRRRQTVTVNPPARLRVGELVIEPTSGSALIGRETVHFTPTQFRALVILASHAGQPVDRSTLIAELFPDMSGPRAEHLLDVHISRLRSRLASGPQPAPLLINVRGRGFALLTGVSHRGGHPRGQT